MSTESSVFTNIMPDGIYIIIHVDYIGANLVGKQLVVHFTGLGERKAKSKAVIVLSSLDDFLCGATLHLVYSIWGK